MVGIFVKGAIMTRRKGHPIPPTEGKHWGAAIAAKRVSVGMTQHLFAELLNVNVRTLQAWESGRRTPPYANIIEREVDRIVRTAPPYIPPPPAEPRKPREPREPKEPVVPTMRDPNDRRRRIPLPAT